MNLKQIPLHPVISFSVINYVVSRGIPTRVAKSLFFLSQSEVQHFSETILKFIISVITYIFFD